MADMLYLCIKDSKDIYKCGSFELFFNIDNNKYNTFLKPNQHIRIYNDE